MHLNSLPKAVRCALACLALTLLNQGALQSEDALPGVSGLDDLPVREVTVFKDGHAFVLHEGEARTDDNGHVRLDYLPTPVIGTFWPYTPDNRAVLTSVAAERQRIEKSQTALTIRELLQANAGTRVMIRDDEGTYAATIVGIPERSSVELAEVGASGADERLSQQSELILLRTSEGTKVVPLDRIIHVTFIDDPATSVTSEEFRNVLTLDLDWGDAPPPEAARVGLAYLQRGIRWIPQYRITVEENNQATVRLQATLLNEMCDLETVTTHLVVGVPSFLFKETLDPIALNATAAQLSQYFQEPSQTAYAFSNSIMSQTTASRMGEVRGRVEAPAAIDLGPDVANSGAREDLYIFTVHDVTLKKGGRLVMPIGEWTLPFEELYTLTIPVAPPPEVMQQFDSRQQAELTRMLYAPKVAHTIRLTNNQQVPLTTAPALILKDGRLLGQHIMTYTSPGGSVDLDITTAVNVPVRFEENETGRTSNAASFAGNQYDRIDLSGSIHLRNFLDKPARVEVERFTLGVADRAGQDGQITRLSPYTWASLPDWWQSYRWPGWWSHLNSVSRIEWDVTIPPGESQELTYDWHYFWR